VGDGGELGWNDGGGVRREWWGGGVVKEGGKCKEWKWGVSEECKIEWKDSEREYSGSGGPRVGKCVCVRVG